MFRWIFCHLWWHPAWLRTISADVELVWRESHQHHQIWKDPGNCSKFMDMKKNLGSIGISWISKVLEMVWILEKIISSLIKWSPQDQDCPPPPLPRWAQHSPHDQFARVRQTCDFFFLFLFSFFFLSKFWKFPFSFSFLLSPLFIFSSSWPKSIIDYDVGHLKEYVTFSYSSSNCTAKKHGKSPNFKRYDDRSREWLWKQAPGWGIVDVQEDVNSDESCDDIYIMMKCLSVYL